MFKLGVLAMVAALGAVAPAQTADPVFKTIPGRTLAEKKVQWAWSVLPVVVKACRYQTSCQMNDTEKAVLETMLVNLPLYSESSLEFVSERENPDRFNGTGSEAHRIAVTGLTPQAKITLNIDRIPDLSLRDLVGILGHEIVHHTGAGDDVNRLPDVIGNKLARYYEVNMVISGLEEFGHPEIQAHYFGVGVPENTDYFKTFPMPASFQDARVLLLDKESAFDLTTFDFSHTSNCFRLPNGIYVNQQVSDPWIRISPWFKGDKKVDLNFSVRTRNVCLKRESLPNADMVGYNMIGQMVVQLELAQPEQDQWQNSALKIYQPTLRALSHQLVPQESLDALALVKVEQVVSAPATVAAGGTWKVELLLRFRERVPVSGCDAPIRGLAWRGLDLFGMSPPLVVDRCEVRVQPDGLYFATLEKNIPADTYSGEYAMEMVALGIPADNGGMAIGKLTRPLTVKVDNPQSPRPLKILSYKFLGVNGHQLQAEREYAFEVRLENANDIFDGLISAKGVLSSGDTYNFVTNMATNQEMFLGPPSIRKEGNVLVATYRVKIDRDRYGDRVKSLVIYTLHFTTSNFGEIVLDLRDNPDVYSIQ